MRSNITDPSYISEQMFDKAMREKFHDNLEDAAVRTQMVTLLQTFRAAQTHDQTITDILYASQVSRRTSPEGIAEIGFVMGLQFGFELAQSFPPLGTK